MILQQPLNILNHQKSLKYNQFHKGESIELLSRTNSLKKKSSIGKSKTYLFQEEKDAKQLEDGKLTKYNFSVIQFQEKACMLVSILGFLLSAVQVHYILRFNKYRLMFNIMVMMMQLIHYYYDQFQFKLLHQVIIFLAYMLYLVILTKIKYTAKLVFLKSQQRIAQNENLYQTDEFQNFLIELLIIVPHPNPLLKDKKFNSYNYHEKTTLSYYYNEIISIYMLLRLIIIIKAILNETLYSNQRAFRICKMYGCENGYYYALKCLMKRWPLLMIGISIISSIVVFGYALRICERPLDSVTTNQEMLFGQYTNAMWCVILTMVNIPIKIIDYQTTVGYGDYYARSTPGRLITFIICIWGVFTVSLMVVSLSQILEMDSPEEKSLNLLMRLDKRAHAKLTAAFVLTQTAQLKFKQRSGRMKNKEDLKKYIRKIKRNMKEVKEIQRQIKGMVSGTSFSELLNMNYDFVKNELKEIQKEQEKIIKINEKVAHKLGILKQPQNEKKN